MLYHETSENQNNFRIMTKTIFEFIKITVPFAYLPICSHEKCSFMMNISKYFVGKDTWKN